MEEGEGKAGRGPAATGAGPSRGGCASAPQLRGGRRGGQPPSGDPGERSGAKGGQQLFFPPPKADRDPSVVPGGGEGASRLPRPRTVKRAAVTTLSLVIPPPLRRSGPPQAGVCPAARLSAAGAQSEAAGDGVRRPVGPPHGGEGPNGPFQKVLRALTDRPGAACGERRAPSADGRGARRLALG